MMEFSSEDLFLVTGASSGIGRSTAAAVIAQGGSVIACARNREKLEELKRECPAPERLFVEPRDLAEDIAGLPKWLKEISARYGKLRGMVCGAGTARINPLRSIDLDELRKLFDLNYFAPIFLAKGFADFRVHASGDCSVVMIGSVSALRSDKGHLEYSGTKAALISSAVAIGRELAEKRIRVNCVSPSNVRTPLTEASGEQYLQEQAANYPFGIGEADDVSNMITFLLSAKAKWITCQNYVVDCGSK